jgi:hypothetical protein
VTPAQERAAEALAKVSVDPLPKHRPDSIDQREATAALTAALDEAEMVEAMSSAPCLIRPGAEHDGSFIHPECAARAVLDLILGP